MGKTKCLDKTGGLEISAISIKPTISKSVREESTQNYSQEGNYTVVYVLESINTVLRQRFQI